VKGVRELEEDEGTKGEGVDEGKSSIESQKSQGAEQYAQAGHGQRR